MQFDLHLNDKVQSALSRDPHLFGRNLRFESSEGRVILKGEVRSFFHKQMAQEIVRRLDGVEEVDNQIQVNWLSHSGNPTERIVPTTA